MSTPTLNQINDVMQLVMFGNLTDDQFNQIYSAVKYAKEKRDRKKMTPFCVGDTVRFSYKGRTVTGEVSKLGRKYVQVREGYTTFSVSPELLNAA